MKKLLALILALSLLATIAGCKKQKTAQAAAPKTQEQQEEHLVILYTADVHGVLTRPAYSSEKSPMGYAALKAYAEQLKAAGETVVLVDGGDAGAGRQFMEQLDYFVAVPGAEELALGVQQLQKSKTPYICCNLLDETSGKPLLEPYKIFDCGKKQVAFVGITYLEQNAQTLYDCVQNAIDQAQNQGADFVIAVGYLGAEPADSPLTSADVIANSTGLSAFLDARSHVITQNQTLKDSGSKDVPVLAVGAELTNIGHLELELKKGKISTKLVSGLADEDQELLTVIREAAAEETAEGNPEETTTAAN